MAVAAPLAFDRPSVVVPMYYLGDATRIIVDDKDYVLVSQDVKKTVLRDRNGFDEEFSHEQIYALHCENRFRIERGSSELALALPNLTDVATHKLERAFFYADALDEFVKIQAVGPDYPGLREAGFKRKKVTLGAACLEDLIPIIEKTVNEQSMRGTTRGGTVWKWRKLVCPRHFYRLFNVYAENGFRVESLVSGHNGPGVIPSRHHPDDLLVWLDHAKLYATKKRPKVKAAFQMLQAKVFELNAERELRGQRLHQMPSAELFAKMVKSLGKYYIVAGRLGEDIANASFASVRNGLQIRRPGQRIEMDEWKIDLVTLLTFSGLTRKMTDEELDLIKSARIWITTVIDVATRAILAMRFSARGPSKDSSLAALEMAVSNKTLISSVIGAGSPWLYNVLFSTLVTDWGPAYRAVELRASVAQLRGEHQFTAAGWAAGRGHIESLFKTQSLRFLHWFEGRTFANVVERGPNGAVARLNVDELNRLLVRAIVDIYHHTPHEGLGGETPHNAWLRLTAKHGILPPLHPDQRRHVFGTKMRRSISDKGVRFLGIHYNHPKLQQMRRDQAALPGSKAPSTDIRIDRFSLRKISFFDGSEWVTAEASMGLPDDVSVWEWVGAAKEHAAIHRANAKMKLSVLLVAVNDLRRAGHAATARAELGTDVPSAKQYAVAEKNYFDREIDDDFDGPAPDLAELQIAHDPLETGIDAFRHLGTSRAAVESQAEAEKVVRPDPSGFMNPADPSSDDDGLDFEY
ncbi:integrase [Rhizobium anhuiense]|uniref:Integrase n=1 Tax=Rhizobium anhuiense TaxID=1184720 RepID=A0ABX4J0F5_9HYPH|nr:DDE-type integrase/transposase/recombinase [Rhizobium anhuiense]PDS40850.1 integrase [Rhizobium anhuiense]PDS47822.1 integrase [Rhizobium anhuiense]